MKYYYDPQNRRPYKERMRNRCIAAGVFIILCVFIASCIFGKDEQSATKAQEQAAIQTTPDTLVAEQPATETPSPAATDGNATGTPAEMQSDKAENLANAQASIVAAIAPENAPEPEIIDSVHIKNQKDVFLAEKIDQMLRRFKPMHSIVLVVEPKSNEIVAWGETKDYKVQNEPDYFTRNTFPAASLAKTITIAAAMESNRIVKIILEMEMASLVVPPPLLEYKPVGGSVGNKRKRGDSGHLRHGQFRCYIGRILATVIPRGIAPGQWIARSGKQRLHQANKRNHGDYFFHREIHAGKDRKTPHRRQGFL